MNWLRRGLIALVVLAGLALIGSQVFKRQIGEAVFERAVASNLAVDRSGELPDGIHVYLCGTGSPMPDVTRAGPCIGVLAGDQAFIFDAGSGSVRKLGSMGFPMTRLEAAYLTHLHSDHIDGLGELLLQAWITGERNSPLPVSGPTGTDMVVNGLNAAYEIDRGLRIAHHGPGVADPAGFGGAPMIITLPTGPQGRLVVYDEAGIRITAIRVSHAPVDPAFGYRIDYGGRSVAISGDTIYHPGFVAGAEGVDVLLHEALDPEMVGQLEAALTARGRERIAKIMSDIPSYHATPEDAARAASEAGARELVYYHTIPPLPARIIHPVFLGEAGDIFGGPITIGEDGMIISMPAGGTEIVHSKAF
ncbi:MAG: MBL fold metallo-hydrolase [Hyphomonadaceae bacterium]|nr:MBL fold metallo-hydrolase [Hyphomonadaceae bacterium]